MSNGKKCSRLAVGLLAAGLAAWPGCKRAEPPPPPGTMQMFGINVELPRLERAFQDASPELQTAVREIKKDCRTWQLAKMGAALEGLGREPGLTEPQKKAVGDVLGQVKRVLAKKAALDER